jgi:hypothetical protein
MAVSDRLIANGTRSWLAANASKAGSLETPNGGGRIMLTDPPRYRVLNLSRNKNAGPSDTQDGRGCRASSVDAYTGPAEMRFRFRDS